MRCNFDFSAPKDSTDESSLNLGKTILGVSTIRECQLLPLSKGTEYRKSSSVESNENEPKRDFFTQMAYGNSHLSRMVMRIRLEPMTHDITKDPSLGRMIYVNNRFQVATTLIHELMHTCYAMVDFYYRDLSIMPNFKTKTATGPVTYSGLSLGELNTNKASDMEGTVSKNIYPEDKFFDIKKYHWQINNVDNYMTLLTKLYLMDDELVKLHKLNGDTKALEDKKALATMRLNTLTHFRDEAINLGETDTQYKLLYKKDINQIKRDNMTKLIKLEEFCWVRKDNRYKSIVEQARKTNDISQRFE